MKKIFFIVSRFPLPKTGGREKTLLEYLDYLQAAEVEIYLFAFDKRRREEIPEIDILLQNNKRIKEIHILSLPSVIAGVINTLFFSLLLQKKSFQESAFYSRRTRCFLMGMLAEIKPDVIFCDIIRTAQYFEIPVPNVLKIFDMDDILSKRYRYLQNSKGDILGNMSGRFPFFIKFIIETLLRKYILLLEAKLVEKSEIRYSLAFSKTILVSPIEQEQLSKKLNGATVHYLYPSATECEFDTNTVPEPQTLGYMGFLGNPHNETGFLYFLEHILPKLITNNQHLKLLVIGSGITKGIKSQFDRYCKNIQYLGFVPDYRPHLLKINVFIAPIYFGTGIKTKIIDAMALGLPVVATRAAVEGLKVEHGEQVMIAENDIEFVENIQKLILDKKLNDRLRKNACIYIQKYHNFNILQKKFLEILEV